jgi:hypothetical protein
MGDTGGLLGSPRGLGILVLQHRESLSPILSYGRGAQGEGSISHFVFMGMVRGEDLGGIRYLDGE